MCNEKRYFLKIEKTSEKFRKKLIHHHFFLWKLINFNIEIIFT